MTSEESQPAPGMPPKLNPEEEKLVAELVADGLSVQDKFRSEPLYQHTGKGHYESGTAEGIHNSSQEIPLSEMNANIKNRFQS